MGRRGENACSPAQPLFRRQSLGAGVAHPRTRPTAPGAVASLVLGILGLLGGFLGIVLGALAVVKSHEARRAMAAAPGRYEGLGLAKAGQACGGAAIVVGTVALVWLLLVLRLNA